ncbi:hypothetical protein Avbf_12320, partial [Armadillidium vulgare]
QSRQPQDLSASLDSSLFSTDPSLQSQALSASIDRRLASIGTSRDQEYLNHRFQEPLQNSSSVISLQLSPGLRENLRATGAIPRNNSNGKRQSSPEIFDLVGFSDEMKRYMKMPECETPDTNSSATNETRQSSSEYSDLLGSTDPIERLMMMPKCKTPDTNNKIDSLMMNPRWKFPDANYILGNRDPSLSSFESQQSLSEMNRNQSYPDNRNMDNQSSDDEMERLACDFEHFNVSSSDDNDIINDIKMCFQRAADACDLHLNSGASNLSSTEQNCQYGLAASSRVSEGGFSAPYLQIDVSDDNFTKDPTRNLNVNEDSSHGSFDWKLDGTNLKNREPPYMSPDVESTRTNLDLSRSYGNISEYSCTENASNTQLNNTYNILEDSSRGHVSITTGVLGQPYYQNIPVDGTSFSPDTNFEQYTIDERGYLRDPTNELYSVNGTGTLHDPNYRQYIVDEAGTLHYPIYGQYPVDETVFSHDPNYLPYPVEETGSSHDPNFQVNPITETGFASGVASDVLESEQDRSYNNNSNWNEFDPKGYQPSRMTLVDFVPSEITVVKTKKTKKKERKLRAMRDAAAAENASESSNNSPSLSSVSSSLKDLNLGNNNLNVLEETQSSVSPSERTQSNVSPTEQAQSIASTSEQAQNGASTFEEEQTNLFKSENAQSSGSSFEQAQSRGSPSKQSQTNVSAKFLSRISRKIFCNKF